MKPLGLSDEILQIMANRNIQTVEEAMSFLKPSLANLNDPFLMADMEPAVDLLIEAIEEDWHIHIVGDYDQDGNSATVTLIRGIRHFHDRITYAIPDRIEDGYGLNVNMVEHAAKIKADLIITCDNGIAAHDAVARAVELGMRVIVTDHHRLSTGESGEDLLPAADAVLNPHRSDCAYPYKELCGAGVAFKLVSALFESLGGEEEELYDLLQFVAMGTVCDVVDLTSENRILVTEGLKRINRTQNPGLQALIKLNSWNKPVNVYALGFVLGPCINASGRLSTARLGVELFLEEDENLVKEYALELIRLNNERKRLTQEATEAVLADLESGKTPITDVIVAYTGQGHESIVGIVAGRVKDRFHRPTIVLTDSSEDGLIKGSARSIEEYNMFEKLSEAADRLVSFGGHTMAAGLTLRTEDLDTLRSMLNDRAGLTREDLTRKYTIDIAYSVARLETGFIENIGILEPFGKGNPKPVMADKGIDVLMYRIIGKNRNVLKLTLRKDEKIIEAVAFSDIDRLIQILHRKFGEDTLKNYSPRRTKPNLIDMIYYPTINEFRGERTVELQIVDIR